MKKTLFPVLIALFAVLGVSPLHAQNNKVVNIDEMYPDYREVYRDTVMVADSSSVFILEDTPADPYRVLSNPFRQNWFIFATGGAHTFRGDYSNSGPFTGTISPDYSVGFGKWFMPWLGLKAEFIQSSSRGYTGIGHYGTGEWINNDIEKMKTGWLDFSGSAMLNLTRLFKGYEGYGARENMGQFLLNLGIGAVHHLGYAHDHGSDNELAAHIELQYSQFLTPAKNLSLDIKARSLLYESNHDLVYGVYGPAAHHVDANLGLHLGLTYYFGKNGNNGWRRGSSTIYRNEYRETEVPILKIKENERPVQSGTLTFFVFYPNNYSGRNDAPQIADAAVNAIDYLAGGIYTEKRYVDNDLARQQLQAGKFPTSLATIDLPTEPANRNFAQLGIQRGYEMAKDVPISLSMDPKDALAFGEKAGFFYAPINDGLNLWHYRVDDATLRQQLLSGDNYRETTSFGLNAHSGLDIVKQNMDLSGSEELVSFADMYAALTTNEGFISQYADAATVQRILDIINNGVILQIQADGIATSQDNYSGQDAARIGLERNTALAQNRAKTVIDWLAADPRFSNVRSQSYVFDNETSIRTVNDKSTRGLNAKVNRCVRVRIKYMMK
jgi:hypothetical protein